MKQITIPQDIGSMPFLDTVSLYQNEFGWVIHPLRSAREGGKSPLIRNWKKLDRRFLTPEKATNYFSGPYPSNIGCVPRRPQIVIDLDSKKDRGKSVRTWLESQSGLCSFPREKTGGGAHIHLICENLPVFFNKYGKPYRSPIVSKIDEQVTAELFFDGLNVVLSPSKHPNGHVYHWETFGDIPQVTWRELQDWFGFRDPGEEKGNKRSYKPKPKPYWSKYSGDLRTLDLPAVFKELGLGCELINADEQKYAVECPWRNEHSDTTKSWAASDSSTTIWNEPKKSPAFKCLHSHCEERSLEVVLDYAEKQGLKIDGFCSETRVWSTGQKSEDGVTQIVLPATGKPDSEFAKEIGEELAGKNCWFNYSGKVVSISVITLGDDYECFGFHPVTTVEAGTNLEQHLQTGKLKRDAAGDTVFLPQSLKRDSAAYLLSAKQLLERLPKVTRILDSPIPILKDGEIFYPKLGYDPALQCFISPHSPVLSEISYEDSLKLIDELLEDFCFANQQAKTNAIAKLLSPFCRGLMGWSSRMPLWVFEANRERSGKDYLCELIQIVHEGRSSSHPAFESDGELRKKITSALLAGARRMHFGNIRGHVASRTLEQAITSKYWEDRILGGNQNQAFSNELEFSMSTNVGTTWTPDLEHRMLLIELFLAQEDPNDRRFKHPDLHRWAKDRRPQLLSALATLVKRWDRAGRPKGSAAFASFPEWANVVGGIMEANNLGTPKQPSSLSRKSGGDETTLDMKALYKEAYSQFESNWISKKELYDLVQKLDLFSWWNIEERKGQTSLGKAINRFEGRQLGGIVLEASGTKNNRRYRFNLLSNQSKISEADLRTSGTSNKAGSGQEVETSDTGSYQEGTSGTSGTYNYQIRIEKESHTANTKEKINIDELKQVPDVPDVPSTQYRVLTEPALLNEVVEKIKESSAPVALDIETYGNGLNPWRGDIRLLSLAIPNHPAWLLDLRSIGYNLGELSECLKERQIIAHNAKFDLLWLLHKCNLKLNNVFCTLNAARLLSNGKRDLKNGLYSCWKRFLGLAPGEDFGNSDWGGMFLTEEQLEYAALDVLHLNALKDKQLEAINEENLEDVLKLENRLVPIVVEMEHQGFGVNKDRLLGVIDDYTSELNEAYNFFKDSFGESVNPNSPSQLKNALEKKGVKLANTSEQTLKEEGNALTTCILNYRSAKKQIEQAEALLKAIESDDRIHTRFEPTGTNTGRFSSRSPNLQNIGRGKLRDCFVPAAGNLLVVADYSQVELRVAAVVAGENKMIEAYKNGVDLHSQTASLVLEKPIEEVTKDDRQLAKAVNFGLLYGQGVKGLIGYAKKGFGVEMEYERARKIHKRFFSAYTKLQEWHKSARAQAANGVAYVKTALGRKRWLPQGSDYEWTRFAALVNTSVQGGAADALKQAIIDLSSQLPKDASIVSTVHDELIVECLIDDAEKVGKLVEAAMIGAANKMFPGVRFEVEAGICESWAEK